MFIQETNAKKMSALRFKATAAKNYDNANAAVFRSGRFDVLPFSLGLVLIHT